MRNLLILAISVSICSSYHAINERLDRIVDRVAGSESLIAPEELDELWSDYKALHDHVLRNEPESKRQFNNHVYKVIDHNRMYKHGAYTYKLGINAYSHMSDEEFNNVMHGFRPPTGKRYAAKNYKNSLEKSHELFEKSLRSDRRVVDWRNKGAVSSVKSQGECGACYAFSAAGALEGMYALAGHNITELSEQQLVDCTAKWENHGCDGGDMNICFKYVNKVGGIQSSADYPYYGVEAQCKFDASRVVTTCGGYVEVPTENPMALLRAVRRIGPISVAIDGETEKFLAYKKGVFSDSQCSSTNLNHGVLLVGYGTEIVNNIRHPYWLVKNSWGESWGENGYVKMSRRQPNICGITSYASFPVPKR